MPRTREDLAQRALKMVGATGAGQSHNADDMAAAMDEIDGMLEDLARRTVTSVTDPDSIPDAEFFWLAVLLGWRLPDFASVPEIPAEIAEARLRALTTADDPGTPIKAVYY